MLDDQRFVPLSTAIPTAVTTLDQAVEDYLGFKTTAGSSLKAALKADPDLVMGHCLMGYFLLLMGMPALLPRAIQALAKAEALMEMANTRERYHIQALSAWLQGQTTAALDCWETLLLSYPRDVIALKLANYHHFYRGDSQQVRDSVARILPQWRGVPGESYLRSMYAFGLEECGDYRNAERIGRQAVERNPADIWGVHAVAHILDMEDRHQEGYDWIAASQPHWQDCNNFRYHVIWHQLLLALDHENYHQVIAGYDEQLYDSESEENLDLCNDAALLQRLELHGIDVGDRWQALFDKVQQRHNEQLLAFVDVHFALILASQSTSTAAHTLLENLQHYSSEDRDNARTTAAVGMTIAEAMVAYRQEDYSRCVVLLSPIRYQIQAIGGSHAQRDLFAMILVDATIRVGDHRLARALLAERVAQKPNNAWSWRRYGEVLSVLGEPGAADAARRGASLGRRKS